MLCNLASRYMYGNRRTDMNNDVIVLNYVYPNI